MLIRTNPHNLYRPAFHWDRTGLLVVTKRFILATGVKAVGWA